MIIDVNGIVVAERNYSENDKIITIFCDDGSLHSVKVIAGRKLKNVNRSKTQMFCYCSFKIKENSDKFSTLREATIIENFLPLKIDMNKYYFAIYFCELIVKLGYYNTLEKELFDQFYLALNKLIQEENYQPIRILFEFIILKHIGLQPHLDACVVCGNTDIVSVDYKLGGFICSNCFNYTHQRYEIKTLAMLKTLNSLDFTRVGKITLSKDVEDAINKFIDNYIEYHLNMKLNTKQYIL